MQIQRHEVKNGLFSVVSLTRNANIHISLIIFSPIKHFHRFCDSHESWVLWAALAPFRQTDRLYKWIFNKSKIFFKYVTYQSSALKLFAMIGNNYCVFESRGLSSFGCWRFLSFPSHIYGCRWPSFLPFLYSSSIHPSNLQFFSCIFKASTWPSFLLCSLSSRLFFFFLPEIWIEVLFLPFISLVVPGFVECKLSSYVF